MEAFPRQRQAGHEDSEALELTLATRASRCHEETRKRRAASAWRRMQAKQRLKEKRQRRGAKGSGEGSSNASPGSDHGTQNGGRANANAQGDAEFRAEIAQQFRQVYATGPDGNIIEGILYGARSDGGVEILCVCHGAFFSAMDFVLHSGMGLVPRPLRYIKMITY